MKWADAHRIAMIEAAHAHRDLDVGFDRPIDIFDAIRRHGLVLGFEYFPRLSGVYVADAVAPGIAVSSQHGLARQRYTAAHELAHHRFGHGTTVDPEVDPLASWGSSQPGHMGDNEKLAEAFAAWFLMPRKLVVHLLETLGITAPSTPREVYQLSLRLGTSYRATARHLVNLKLATVLRSRQWLGVAPKAIKSGLLPGVALDFRRDVWQLTAADGNQHYLVRPGDRLILTVPETPSSGYVWHIGDSDKILDVTTDAMIPAEQTTPAADAPVDRPVGASFHRVIVLSVEVTDDRVAELDASGTDRLETTLDGILRQPWDEASRADGFGILLDVRPPRQGIDPEALLVA